MVSIKGIEKPAVLKALYDKAACIGMGIFQFAPGDMELSEAAKLLEGQTYFDYLKGRVMKVDLSGDDGFDEYLYDRDNGRGAAQGVIDRLRGKESAA